MSKHILIITHEMLPLEGCPASGGGMRAWGLGKGLEAHGFQVTFSIPRPYLEGLANVPPEILAASTEGRRMDELVAQHSPDVIVLEQPRALHWYEPCDIPVVIDLPGPVYLEDRFRGEPGWGEMLDKLESLSHGDMFLTSHARQKSYFLSWLALAGVDLTKDQISVVPFGLPTNPPPARALSPEPSFVYSGFFHTWQNPAPALRAVVEALDELGMGRLEIIGGKLPTDIYGEGRYFDPRAQLPESQRVTYLEPLPWDQLCQRLATHWAGLNLLQPNLERENAFPIREVNYLWCGLPPIVSPQSPQVLDLIQRGAGWAVDPADTGAIKALIRQLVEQPEQVRAASQAARTLALEKYTWDRAVEPLARFCDKPFHRSGKQKSFLLRRGDREELSTVWKQLGQVSEAHAATQRDLERRNNEYEALEQTLSADCSRLETQLEERTAELEASSVEQGRAHDELDHARIALRTAQQEGEDAHGRVAHSDEVLRRLTGDLEHHRRHVGQLQDQLKTIHSSYTYRILRKLRRWVRPLMMIGGLALAVAASIWLVPDLHRDQPQLFWACVALLSLASMIALYTCRRHLPESLSPKWRWLTPTRSRWLGAIKLCFLFVLSLVLMVYLKIWERIHRIRVFP